MFLQQDNVLVFSSLPCFCTSYRLIPTCTIIPAENFSHLVKLRRLGRQIFSVRYTLRVKVIISFISAGKGARQFTYTLLQQALMTAVKETGCVRVKAVKVILTGNVVHPHMPTGIVLLLTSLNILHCQFNGIQFLVMKVTLSKFLL